MDVKQLIEDLESTRYNCTGSKDKETINKAIEFIEAQQEKLKRQANNIHALLGMDDIQVQRIKAEAVKEFAEKLKEIAEPFVSKENGLYLLSAQDIKDILEMVGAENG